MHAPRPPPGRQSAPHSSVVRAACVAVLGASGRLLFLPPDSSPEWVLGDPIPSDRALPVTILGGLLFCLTISSDPSVRELAFQRYFLLSKARIRSIAPTLYC